MGNYLHLQGQGTGISYGTKDNNRIDSDKRAPSNNNNKVYV